MLYSESKLICCCLFTRAGSLNQGLLPLPIVRRTIEGSLKYFGTGEAIVSRLTTGQISDKSTSVFASLAII